ncbi:hypothetical protein DL98DRAFT_520038 [Cadophora sp. DSE1049]|nr:hypothetical protein DL98DRAFT_520038 [Cadophora sp. DSE1049]
MGRKSRNFCKPGRAAVITTWFAYVHCYGLAPSSTYSTISHGVRLIGIYVDDAVLYCSQVVVWQDMRRILEAGWFE